jgi:hypothetical protein
MTRNPIAATALAALAALDLSAGMALAQSAALPDTPPPQPAGPVETYRSIEHSQGIAPDGTRLDSVRSVEQSRVFTDGDGELSARTHLEESGGTHAVAPPLPLTPSPPPPPGGPVP